MNYDAITIEDCLDNYIKKDEVTIIENGRVIRFEKEKKDEESHVART